MRFALVVSFLFILVSSSVAQKAEVTISLNETFFDAALESMFANGAPLEFPIAMNESALAISTKQPSSKPPTPSCSTPSRPGAPPAKAATARASTGQS